MDNALILVTATLIGLAFGYMVGRFSGFVDAAKKYNTVLDDIEELEAQIAPPRDARGRFIKRK